MHPPHELLLAILTLGPLQIVSAQTLQATLGFFLFDVQPQSLSASIVAATSNTDDSLSSATRTTTLSFACPTASPAADICRSAGLDGAQLIQNDADSTSGNLGGTLSRPIAPGVTSIWHCSTTTDSSAGSSVATTSPAAACQQSLISGSSTAVTSTMLDGDYLSAHYATLTITAGLEKLSPPTGAAAGTGGGDGGSNVWVYACPTGTSSASRRMLFSDGYVCTTPSTAAGASQTGSLRASASASRSGTGTMSGASAKPTANGVERVGWSGGVVCALGVGLGVGLL